MFRVEMDIGMVIHVDVLNNKADQLYGDNFEQFFLLKYRQQMFRMGRELHLARTVFMLDVIRRGNHPARADPMCGKLYHGAPEEMTWEFVAKHFGGSIAGKQSERFYKIYRTFLRDIFLYISLLP